MFRSVLATALILLPAATVAQQAAPLAESGQPPQRIRNVTLAADQKCPPANGNEVVVCSRLDEPYRIPKALREDKPIPAANQAWTNRVAAADQIGRVAGGLPDTCSPVGTGGQSGCSLQQNQAWAASRRAAANGQSTAAGQ